MLTRIPPRLVGAVVLVHGRGAGDRTLKANRVRVPFGKRMRIAAFYETRDAVSEIVLRMQKRRIALEGIASIAARRQRLTEIVRPADHVVPEHLSVTERVQDPSGLNVRPRNGPLVTSPPADVSARRMSRE